MTLSACSSYIGHVDRFQPAARRTAIVGSADCCPGHCGTAVSWAAFCQHHCLYVHSRLGLPWRVHGQGYHSRGAAHKNRILAGSILCVCRLCDVVHVEFGEGAMLKRKALHEKLQLKAE